MGAVDEQAHKPPRRKWLRVLGPNPNERRRHMALREVVSVSGMAQVGVLLCDLVHDLAQVREVREHVPEHLGPPAHHDVVRFQVRLATRHS